MDAVIRQRALPLPLRMIPDPPPLLHCRGAAAVLAIPAVAIVGSRRCTRQGADIAFTLGRDLAAQGLAVVSGLAYGIDTAAHRGALDASGVTIAVLGGGLGRIYPRANENLAAQIVGAGGALVTEYAADVAPRKHHFPARNRIVSGLCLGVVIVEASDRSGSLITARMALEQGRDVMAVPSSVASPLSHGCHRLIRDGAALVECAEHVLEALGVERVIPAADDAAASEDDPVLAQVGAEVTSLERVAAGGVAGSDRIPVDHLPPARHHGHHGGQAPVVHVGLHGRTNPIQARGRHAGVRRTACRQPGVGSGLRRGWRRRLIVDLARPAGGERRQKRDHRAQLAAHA
jgi:DNA processing protein